MAERKKKAADQAATTTTTAKRGRKPAAAKAAQVEKPVKPETKPAETAEQKTTYKVECKSVLNVRSGAGKEYLVIRQIDNGSDVDVFEQANGWGRIGANEWVMLEFLK